MVYLAGIKQAGLPSNTFAIVKSPKAQTAWKVVLGRWAGGYLAAYGFFA